MPEVTSYAPGSPSLMELSSPDVEASKVFYRGLFGWEFYTVADPRLGEFIMFTLGGTAGPETAGLAALADDTMPPTWTCYFTVTDIASAVAAVREAGGTVFADGTDVAHLGRMALVADSQGAGFGLWQQYTFPGAALVDEPGAMSWAELTCPDIEAAAAFYSHVLGWEGLEDLRGVEGRTYLGWRIGGRPVAGVVPPERRLLKPGTAHWMPFFGVTDCDASANEAERLGANVLLKCADTPHGRFAMICDPTSALLAVLHPARPLVG
ncbi:VOC family protein [Actinomadura sp. 9N407]|uniref:VOC family protein n=1 Tax=Actinomadura sp. 9N407 TaxID=3375154 RepID=UPI00379532D7